MTTLQEALEVIYQERTGDDAPDRVYVLIEEDENMPIDLFSGTDLVILRESGDAIIARIGWGSSGVYVDVRAFKEGEQASTSTMELAGTTTVMAT